MTPITHTHRPESSAPDRPRGSPRRAIIAGVAGLATAALAGCLGGGDDPEPAEPVDLTGGRECAVCGMVIEEHYGPAGQVFYADDPDDEPTAFDSVTELVVHHEGRVDRGEEHRGAFVTDYSSVDYDFEERDGTTHVSTHVDAEAFADATTARYVVDSEVEGAMGPDFLPFSSADDAEAFTDDHGGDVLEWDDLPALA